MRRVLCVALYLQIRIDPCSASQLINWLFYALGVKCPLPYGIGIDTLCVFCLFCHFIKRVQVTLFYLEPESLCFPHQNLPASPSKQWEGSCSLRLSNSQLALKLKIVYPKHLWVHLKIFLHIRFIGTCSITSKMCFHTQRAWIPVSARDLGHIINNNTLLLIQRQCWFFFQNKFLPLIYLPSPSKVGRTGLSISFHRWVKTRSEGLSAVVW